MKLGIFGGSFNPVHLGHLHLANEALTKLNLDRVVFVPAYRNPFKADNTAQDVNQSSEYIMAAADDRINKIAAAVTGDPRFAIDNCEIRRAGVSYTIDTLEDIIGRYLPTGKPVLIIGDDVAAEFTKWREYKKILQLADIAVGRRVSAAAVDYPFPHIQIKNDTIDISSSAIRKKSAVNLLNNSTTLELFPAPSLEYVRILAIGIISVETEARETLSTERFLHSRHAALAAFDLCNRFGLDPAAGYLAGIAHDLAKEFDNKQILKIAKAEGIKLTSIEKEKPNLLHGMAAAVLLRDRFSINNKDILEAVACHTAGFENMGPLAKAVYIADKAESSRNIEPALRKLCNEAELDRILFAVLEKIINKLKARKLDLSEDTIKLFNKIKDK